MLPRELEKWERSAERVLLRNSLSSLPFRAKECLGCQRRQDAQDYVDSLREDRVVALSQDLARLSSLFSLSVYRLHRDEIRRAGSIEREAGGEADEERN